MKCISCHKKSNVWKIVGAIAAVAAAGAALYWLLCAKRKKIGCLCAGDDDGVCCFGDDVPAAPCEDDADAAEETAEEAPAKDTPEA